MSKEDPNPTHAMATETVSRALASEFSHMLNNGKYSDVVLVSGLDQDLMIMSRCKRVHHFTRQNNFHEIFFFADSLIFNQDNVFFRDTN